VSCEILRRKSKVKSAAAETLLCVANYPANTGYAWDFIERLYAKIADHLVTHGVRTLVAYPEIAEPPRTLANSAAEPVVLARLTAVGCRKEDSSGRRKIHKIIECGPGRRVGIKS